MAKPSTWFQVLVAVSLAAYFGLRLVGTAAAGDAVLAIGGAVACAVVGISAVVVVVGRLAARASRDARMTSADVPPPDEDER